MRFAAVLPFVLLSPGLLAAQAEQHALAGSHVAIYDLVGEIRAEAGTGADVVVDVSRAGPDAAQLRVETGPMHARTTLRVIFPGTRVIYPALGRHSSTDLDVEDDGTFGDNSHGRRVRVTGSGSGLEASANLVVHIPAGKTVDLHLAAGRVSVKNVNGDISVDAYDADVSTEGTKGRLSLDVGSGKTTVSDAAGEVDLDCGSGNVTISGVTGSTFKVDAGSGEVRADRITVDDANLDVGSGGISIAGLRAKRIRLDSGSGDVDLGLAGDVERMDVDSGSGDVTLRIPATLGAALEVDAGSGGVKTEIPIAVTQYDSDRLVGRLGDGRGTIRIDSGSGEVRLVKAN